jgi:hypothetical protein
LENLLQRIEKLEKEMEQVKNSLRKKVEERKLKLKEKFDIHDRSQNLLHEFESIRIEDTPLNASQINQLKTIIKCFVELVDLALGVEFP